MDTEDELVLCRRPGPNGTECGLPLGHEPENVHAWEVVLPPWLSSQVAEHMEQMETAATDYRDATKRMKFARNIMYVACAINIIAAIANVIGIVS